MITPQALAIFLAVIILLTVVLLLRSYYLPEKYAVTWLFAGIIGLIFAVFPNLLSSLATILGVSNPLNLLFFVSLFFVLLMLMQLSLELAKTREDLRKALQSLALQVKDQSENNQKK